MRWFKPFLIINEHWSGACVSKITWICIVKTKELFIKDLPFDPWCNAKGSEMLHSGQQLGLALGNRIRQEATPFYWTKMLNKYVSWSCVTAFSARMVTGGDYNLLYVIWFLFKDDIAEKDLHNYFHKYM